MLDFNTQNHGCPDPRTAHPDVTLDKRRGREAGSYFAGLCATDRTRLRLVLAHLKHIDCGITPTANVLSDPLHNADQYEIRDGQLVTVINGTPFHVTAYKLGDKYFAARSYEFGYATTSSTSRVNE
ncbi:MAG: hypothetical protein H6823_14335 [Planctomycetaceae bacterium]|nr:hypothetical protein [Planctomycetaceae bacterium]